LSYLGESFIHYLHIRINYKLKRSQQFYLAALLFGVLFHGTVVSFTLGNTYDAYVHMFFAEHYASGWFETWNYKWYTGFTMTSYPPLVHQIIALLSKVIGLKGGFILWAMVISGLFIRGVFHFSRLWVDDNSAGIAALLAVVSSSFVEALHVFWQLPSLTGIALLLNACPELYRWIKEDNRVRFFKGIAILGVVTAAHHVTTIFGMVFFIAPVLGVAVLDRCIAEKGGIDKVRISDFIKEVWSLFPKAIQIGLSIIAITAVVIFPYWYWSKTDPIAQVSIPHGSRANFLERTDLGMVFFVIPWGMMLFFLPGLFYRMFKKRNLFLGLSFALAFLLGTGGTTPIPKMLLGETAFNILTLDRFTFWATVMAIPFMASMIDSVYSGQIKDRLIAKVGAGTHKALMVFIAVALIVVSGLISNLTSLRLLQPDAIDPEPIANFMDRDSHDEWRYLTLGFGDQVAWVAAHTDALSVDGNYHSARRLPEFTTRAVERLENSKYLGMEGLGALHQFLAVPEKYHLKYIFNNDKFYEPLLYFYGWTRLTRLENNIDVWERKDVLPLPSILPKKDIPSIQKWMWGILPLLLLLLAFLLNVYYGRSSRDLPVITPTYNSSSRFRYWIYFFWALCMSVLMIFSIWKTVNKRDEHRNPEQLLQAYFHNIDFKYFEKAYNLLDPESTEGLDQYILELSLEDGLLASYAKLENINIINLRDISDTRKIYQVDAQWLTAVKAYDTTHSMELIKKGSKWYIVKEDFEKKIPADQFLRLAEVDFFNQGRRKATTETTIREDILDRPEIYIDEAHLVERDGLYSIIGYLSNIDNDPAFVTIDAVLYDKEGKEITSYSVSDHIIHNLLPKEGTPFRIDFEDILWQQTKAKFPDKFIPGVDARVVLDREPVEFVINVRTMVTAERMYKFYGVEHSKNGKDIEGTIINYGNQEIAIPQVLMAQYSDNKLNWVSTNFLFRGIRPQRSKDFEIALVALDDIHVVSTGKDANLLVNSVSRKINATSLPADYFKPRNNKDGYQLYINGLVNFKN
jgi:hypothetical protein